MSDNAKYKHIFIAYASKDQAAYDTLLSQLKLLAKEIPIETWGKAELMPGAEIQKTTQAELQRADIVLILVSHNLLNSESYLNLQSQVQASTTVVPVLLRACMWDSDPFLKDRQALPKSEQYISKADDEDEAYTEIAKEIKKMVVGKVEDTPSVLPVSTSSFWKKAALAILLLIGGFLLALSLFNGKGEPPIDDVTPDEPSVSTTLNPSYGSPIFTTDTSLFKILIIRFEDNLNKDGETHCIGRSIEENFIQLKEKGLPIHAIYADTIASPKYSEEAERIQNHHNADVLIYGLANEIQENCTAANVCFRHVVANTIMTNLGIPKDKGIKHDAEYERMSHSDIEKGKLSVDEQSMEAWVTGLVALKKGDKETYFEEIEKMAKDIAHLSKEEQASRFFNQGDVYYYSNEYKKAIASYTKAIELKPDYARAYYNRGISYRYLKEYKKAIEDFDKMIKLKSNYANAYIYRGVSYNSLKEYKKSIPDFDKAIELKPDGTQGYNNRGVSYYYLKDYKKSISDYDKVIELNPDDHLAYNNRGISHRHLKAYKKAISDYDKVIELNLDDAEAYNNRGVSYRYLKEYKKAILDYNKAIELKLDFAYAYNNRAYVYLKLNQIINAQKDMKKFQELAPKNGRVYRNWCIYHTTQKDFPQAIENLQKAIDLGYDDKEFLQEEELLDPLRSRPKFKRILENMDDENSKSSGTKK